MTFRMLSTRSCVMEHPGRIFKNNRTFSSMSNARRWPTQSESSTTLANGSSAEYISADPNRTPLGFKTPSLEKEDGLEKSFRTVYGVP